MKKKRVLATAFSVIFLSTSFLSVSKADAPTPGSSTDPVITKSYFDQNTLSEAKVKELIASALASQGDTSSGTNSGGSATSSNMSVVLLKSGQTLYAGSGSEFIVRTGKTVVVSKDGEGVPDVTAGKDVAEGAAVELNHLLIFPREGRGIKPSPKNTADIYVMVRGSYLLLNADGSTVTP